VDVDECNATLTGCSVTEFDDCMTPGCVNTEGSFRCQTGFARADENATDALYERILNATAPWVIHSRQICYIPPVEEGEEGAAKTAQPAATLELDAVEPAQLVKDSPAQKELVLRLRTEMSAALNIPLADVVIDDLEPVKAGTAERRRLAGTTVTFSVMLRQGDQMQDLKTQLADSSSPLLEKMAAAEIGLDAQKVEVTVACPAGTRLENGACAKCHGDKYAAKTKVLVNGDMVSTIQCESCKHTNEVPNTRGDGCVCAFGFYDAWQSEVTALDVLRPTRLEIYCWEQEMTEDPTKSRLNTQVDKEGRCVKCPDCVTCDQASWVRERRRVEAAEADDGRGLTSRSGRTWSLPSTPSTSSSTASACSSPTGSSPAAGGSTSSSARPTPPASPSTFWRHPRTARCARPDMARTARFVASALKTTRTRTATANSVAN
jgi:hypothetical protein